MRGRANRTPASDCANSTAFASVGRRLRRRTVECAEVNGTVAVDLEMPGEAHFAVDRGGLAAHEDGFARDEGVAIVEDRPMRAVGDRAAISRGLADADSRE